MRASKTGSPAASVSPGTPRGGRACNLYPDQLREEMQTTQGRHVQDDGSSPAALTGAEATPLPSHSPRPKQFGPKVLVSRARHKQTSRPRAGVPGVRAQVQGAGAREEGGPQGAKGCLLRLSKLVSRLRTTEARKKRKLRNEKRRYIDDSLKGDEREPTYASDR